MDAFVEKRAREKRLKTAADQIIDHRRRLEKIERGRANQVDPHTADGDRIADEHCGKNIRAPQAEADQIAKARLNEMALELITGHGLCLGRTDLRAGKVIKIDGVGKRFSG